MAKSTSSSKRILIDKANTTVVIVVSVAAFVVVFCLVATKTLIGQSTYQSHVISAKRTAINQLKADVTATQQLKSSYTAFIKQQPNAINGDPNGSGPRDGNNAKIVLDALPSGYDFPGLTTSLESILGSQPNVKIGSISGTDDEVAQSSNQISDTPQSVPIPFQISVTGDYNGIQSVINALQQSIRPIQVQTVAISGTQNNLTLSITAQTYYQPAKSFSIGKKVVK